VTFDKNFGELAFRHRGAADSGIVLLRMRARNPQALARIVMQALASRDDWRHHFAVIEKDRIRMTALPR